VADADSGFSSGHVRRASIVNSLEQSGLPLAGIAEAIRTGVIGLDFVDQPTYDRYDGLGNVTFRELSTETGVPVDLLLVIREAMGFAQAGPDDRLRDDELRVVPIVRFMVGRQFRTPVIERALRVAGDSLRRIAETEADWWMTEIQQPLLRAGKSFAELGALSGEFASELGRATDEMLLGLYHGQQSNTWLKNIFEGFEMALEHAGLHSRLERPPAVCFLDLTGYTRLTDERGDHAAAELAGQLARLVQRTSGQHGGRPVKWLGDGVMFYFREPGPGVLAALEMVDGASRAGLPPAHVGLHAGPVLFQEGDYFGRTVNVAARIADYARQGEVLVSQDVVKASHSPGITFAEIGPVELKGLSEPIRLHSARRST
jgi:adenylate cyclase